MTLVVLSFASGQTEFDFGPSVLEVYLQRDQRQAALFDASDEPPNLCAAEQEFAGTFGVVVVPAARVVRADVHVVQPDLALLHLGEAVLYVRASLTEGLHLRSLKDKAGLHGLQDAVIMSGASVLDKHSSASGGTVPSAILFMISNSPAEFKKNPLTQKCTFAYF